MEHTTQSKLTIKIAGTQVKFANVPKCLEWGFRFSGLHNELPHHPPLCKCRKFEIGKYLSDRKQACIIWHLGNDGRNVLDRHPTVCVKVPGTTSDLISCAFPLKIGFHTPDDTYLTDRWGHFLQSSLMPSSVIWVPPRFSFTHFTLAAAIARTASSLMPEQPWRSTHSFVWHW